MSDETAIAWEVTRRRYVNLLRAENVQKVLDEGGYLKSPYKGQPDPKQLDLALVNFLVDFLHLTDKEEHPLPLSHLRELVEAADALFEKEPRFLKR